MWLQHPITPVQTLALNDVTNTRWQRWLFICHIIYFVLRVSPLQTSLVFLRFYFDKRKRMDSMAIYLQNDINYLLDLIFPNYIKTCVFLAFCVHLKQREHACANMCISKDQFNQLLTTYSFVISNVEISKFLISFLTCQTVDIEQ